MKPNIFFFFLCFFTSYLNAQIPGKSDSSYASYDLLPNEKPAYENSKCREVIDRGILSLKQGDMAQAKSLFQKGLQCDTNYKEQAFIIQEIARINSPFAIELLDSLMLRKSTMNAPRHHWELDFLAQCHANMHQYSEAVYYLTEGISEDLHMANHKINPASLSDLSRKFYWRAVYKEKLKDYRGALCDYNKTLSGGALIHPYLDEIYLKKARCLIKLQKYCTALFYLKKTLNITKHIPVKAEAYYYRGQCKHLLNNTNGACWNWSKAGELGVPEAYEMIKKFCQ
jgi:tetratricopeptide (TPR) repeat protein